MRLDVNGIRLFFDVEGAKFVPDGPVMREKPTLILLHGGPGGDHSDFKPTFSHLADIVQLVYVDHRGNGRSDRASRETWNLAQWGDDLRSLCDALEIERPIVVGVSFGGQVAMSYATRHAGHAGKLVLASTLGRYVPGRQHAVFERLGGPEARAISERWEAEGVTEENLGDIRRVLRPLYDRQPPDDPDHSKRSVRSPDVIVWYERLGGEFLSRDLLPDLARVTCPTLVIGGEDDPATPIACQEEIAAALPHHLVRFERFAGAGHGVFWDDARAFDVLREFIHS